MESARTRCPLRPATRASGPRPGTGARAQAARATNESMRDFLRDALHDAGHEVVVAHGRQAVVHDQRAARKANRAADEAIGIRGAARAVIAIDEVGVVFVRERCRVPCRESPRDRRTRGSRGLPPPARAGRVFVALERRAGREDHRGDTAFARATRIGDAAVVHEHAARIADADRAQRGLGLHVDAGRARRAIEQPLCLLDTAYQSRPPQPSSIRQSPAFSRAIVRAAGTALSPIERTASGLGPAVAVDIGAWEISGADHGRGPVRGMGDQRLLRIGDRAFARARGRPARPGLPGWAQRWRRDPAR